MQQTHTDEITPGNSHCHTCGNPPTAGNDPTNPRWELCLECAAVTTVEIPANPVRTGRVPQVVYEGPAWPIAAGLATGEDLWLHQASALTELERGAHTVVATSTASGKSLIFQLWALHNTLTYQDATALIFYPTKALGNDQMRQWGQCCQVLGLPTETIGQIDGDVTMNKRDEIIGSSRIVVMTPDVCHAWLLRKTDARPIKEFLRGLRVIIIDEAHTYENVFGSNSAYLFRRLTSAVDQAEGSQRPQFIAATATIRDPDKHLEKLTGHPFSVIDEHQNGSPRHERVVHHLESGHRGMNSEAQLASLVTSIIKYDPSAQVIAFHDSRQGIERIVQMIDRPGEVMPYRAGYLAQDRRNIEDRLRANTIRAVIATSALELGIDMPDLNYGINLDLPPSRKQFHQRLGRIGRSRPGTFIILTPPGRFREYGETLKEYFNNSVEPSRLYLGNEYITFQQALCLRHELRKSGLDSQIPPDTCEWPEGLETALSTSHGRPPSHLEALASRSNQRPPQLAYGLRSTGEESLEILAQAEKIGSINVSQGIREAYPGAIYRHRGRSYRIEEWARRRRDKTALIRATPVEQTDTRTNPITRRMATVVLDADHIINGRTRANEKGLTTQVRITVTESVEGFEDSRGQAQYYRHLKDLDPRKSRKQLEFPTVGVYIQINEPWFTGDSGEAWQTRRQIGEALRRHLTYQHSIALPDIGTCIENIAIDTGRGLHSPSNGILVYDNIFGGLGLTEDLYREMAKYALQITSSEDGAHSLVSQQNAERFVQWAFKGRASAQSTPPIPGEDDWWQVARPGSEVEVYSTTLNNTVEGIVKGNYWSNGIHYEIEVPGENIRAMDRQLKAVGHNHDWQLWKPGTGEYREMGAELEEGL